MWRVPEVVLNKARVAGATTWAAELPDLIEALSAEWNFVPESLLEGGTESVVIDGHRADGSLAVLKILVPRSFDAADHEITTLTLVGGNGCPELYQHDRARGALLMERLGPSMFDLGLPIAERHRHLCKASARVWRPVPDSGLPDGAEKAQWLIEFITRTWEDLDRPVSERVVEGSIAAAERRILAHDPERAVLNHGDVHQWNALQHGGGYKLVDPDGIVAEPEYDLGVIMREDPVELLEDGPEKRAHRLANMTGLDPGAIWEWGVVERVSTGLLCTQIELQPVGREMLAAAEAVVDVEVT